MPRLCSATGCYTRVVSGRCEAHRRPAWTQARPTQRVRGRKLQQLRQHLFASEPMCRACRVRLAIIRDHIVPLAEGGTDDPENIQPLCAECSDEKTQAESVRGRQAIR